MGRAGLRTGIGAAAIVAAAVAVAVLAGPCGGGAERDARPPAATPPDAAPDEQSPGVPSVRPRAQRPASPLDPAPAVEAPLGEEDDEEETAAPPGDLRVLCVRADTGAPIPDLRVELRWSGNHLSGRTGTDGVWVTPRPPGSAKVRAGEDAEVNGQWYLDAMADVAAGAEEVRVEVSPTGVVAGTVVWPDGTGVRSVPLIVRSDDRVLARSTTESTGEFVVRVPEGTQVEVEASIFDGALQHGTSGPVTATSKDLVIRFVPDPFDAEVEVLVLDPDGRPIPGAQVAALVSFMARGNASVPRTHPIATPSTSATGPDGRARLSGLPRKSFNVSARAPAGSGAGLISATVHEVSARGQQIAVSLVRGWVLSGTVVLPDGGVAVNLPVMTRTESGVSEWLAHTNSAGRFSVEIPSAARGPFRVIAQRARFRGEQGDVAVGASDVRIVLAATD